MTKWPHMLPVLILLSLLAGVLSLPRLHAQEPTLVSQTTHTIYLPLVVRSIDNPGPAKPMISEFGAEPANIRAGGTATLQWRVSNSASVRIEPGIGIVTGTSVTVSPQTTITYTLIATNAAGETRATTTVTVQDGTTPPPDIAGELIFSRSSTRSADIVVDEQGGIHAIAVRDNPRFDEDPLALIYAYCAPANLDRCAERDAWDFVELAAESAFAQIALTPQGQPRILYEEGSGGATYVYAACDNTCTLAENWTRTPTFARNAIGSPYVFDYRPQYFALDYLGRPRFLYRDYHPTGTQEHTGVFYAFCDTNCTNQQSWNESVVTREIWGEQLNLTFTSTGGVRALAQNHWPNDEQAQNGRLSYISCDIDCTDTSNWYMIPLLDRGYEHSQYTLTLDSQDRPRILYYQGYHEDPRTEAQLWYLWCESNCNSVSSWDGKVITSNYAAGDADLTFDAQDRPRIVISQRATLFYAFCDSNCQSAEATWQAMTIDVAASAERASPLKLLPGCIEGSWVAGLL